MRPKSRGNGQGSAYKRGKTWVAQVVIGYRLPSDDSKQPIPIKRRKGGYKTKAEAIAACAGLRTASKRPDRVTLDQLYSEWETSYRGRVGASTMVCYLSAFKHFASLHATYVDLITARDLQECMDSCPSGKRTHQNMRCIARLLWAYALDADYVQKDVTANLYTGKGETKQREPITEEELEVIRAAIPTEPYAAYVYALCYLGFRPGEFLKLKKADLHTDAGVTYLVGGGKTEAGRDRRVPVPAQISDIISQRMEVPGELLFPKADGKPMSDEYFNKHVFKPLMARLGIAAGKSPYSARHTYADKLKAVVGDDHAKAALIGHTDYNFTRSAYQSTGIDELAAITDSLD